MTKREFRELLYKVDRSYDDFVSLVISYIKIPGNRSKALLIRNYIESHPFSDSSDVLQFMIEELDMWFIQNEFVKKLMEQRQM